MSLIIIPNVFSAGATIIASQHNTNFSTIYSDYNGNIDDTNISGSASISYSKLNLTGKITNIDINSSAGIVDTKLAQITTASKVSGAAITGLASLPSGAGVIPTVNLGSGTPSSSNFLRGDGSWVGTGIVFVSATSISSSSSSSNITISNTDFYEVKAVLKSFSADDKVSIRFNNDSGTNYNFKRTGFLLDGAGTAITDTGGSDTSITTGEVDAADSTRQITITFRIYPQRTDNTLLLIKGEACGQDNSSSSYYNDFSGVYYSSSTAVTSFKILTRSGATFNGSVYLYKYNLS